jgi:hypothetical protein
MEEGSMPKDYQANEEKTSRVASPQKKNNQQPRVDDHPSGGLTELQQKVGNQAVQRLIAQRNAAGDYEVDDETAARINQARGGGQNLDTAVQQTMSDSFGEDLSGVRAHTSAEADELNQQLGARAFTTGQDIFFREGEYSPNTGSGQELIAHELTHVVQQQRGDVPGGDGMRVNAPGDAFEQEADAVAKAITQDDQANTLQRQEIPDEEEVQAKHLQRQEEEEIMMQPLEEEEEMLQMQPAQRQEEEEEEEELQLKPAQRQEEEEIMMQPLEEEEEMLQPKKR